MAISAVPAAAQQTPQSYCVSLGSPSCEVLNIEITGGSYSSQPAGIGIVKYCRNGQFAIAPVSLTPQPYGYNSTMGIGDQSGVSRQISSGSSSGNKSTAWTSTALCGTLLP